MDFAVFGKHSVLDLKPKRLQIKINVKHLENNDFQTGSFDESIRSKFANLKRNFCSRPFHIFRSRPSDFRSRLSSIFA